MTEFFLTALIYRFIDDVQYCHSIDCFLVKLSSAFFALKEHAGSSIEEYVKLVNKFLSHPLVLNTLRNYAHQLDVIESYIQSNVRFKNLREHLQAIKEAFMLASQNPPQLAVNEAQIPVAIQQPTLKREPSTEFSKTPPTYLEEVDRIRTSVREVLSKEESRGRILEYLEFLENHVSKIIALEYVERGDLSTRSVELDLAKLAKNSELALHELLIGLARLMEKGYIHARIEGSSTDVLREVGRALAILDHAYMVRDLSREEYKSLVENIWKMADLGIEPVLVDQAYPDKLSLKTTYVLASRAFKFITLQSENLCRKYNRILEVLKSEYIDDLLLEALKIELSKVLSDAKKTVAFIDVEKLSKNIESVDLDTGGENVLRTLLDRVTSSKQMLLESIDSMEKSLSTVRDLISFAKLLEQFVKQKCTAGSEGGV